MNAAARVAESVVVAGRGDLIRGGRGREGRGGHGHALDVARILRHPRASEHDRSNPEDR